MKINTGAVVCRMYDIRPHPHDPRLKIAWLDCFDARYQVVTGDHYQEDCMGVFFHPGTVMPDHVAAEMDLLDRLGGKQKKTVKAKVMKGIPSAGIFYGSVWRDWDGSIKRGAIWDSTWELGRDVSKEFSIPCATSVISQWK